MTFGDPVRPACVREEGDASKRVRFLCDAMLGSLCRWLRLFGYDAEYGGVRMTDSEILVWAAGEGRLLVTRDRELASIGPRTMLVRSSGLEDQLVEVLSRLSLDPAPTLDNSRCTVCNGALEDVTRGRGRRFGAILYLANSRRDSGNVSCVQEFTGPARMGIASLLASSESSSDCSVQIRAIVVGTSYDLCDEGSRRRPARTARGDSRLFLS